MYHCTHNVYNNLTVTDYYEAKCNYACIYKAN